MSGLSFFWCGETVTFRPGETVAAALTAAGVLHFGTDANGQPARYFCGIGACQACAVLVDGTIREACLTPARSGSEVRPVMQTSAGGRDAR
ncbi:2Fe-2S iron-sulfur cluster-binding protein [Pannonibacter phragmitetus]|uniref:2Fe-2S iron-sulfur cluster-binding protein n=1 Tax=Pannonibacter phragmitetus TaxID=121719 RepID=UPI003D2EA54E